MENQTKDGLGTALSLLEAGDPYKAHDALRSLFFSDLNNQEYVLTSNYCNLWCGYLNKDLQIEDPASRGECLILDWKKFLSYLRRRPEVFDDAVFSIHKGVFSKALDCFLKATDEPDPITRSGILRKIGICYKQLGEYENAYRYLSDANKLNANQADILADLADCFALVGNDRNAKVLFKEAFYIDPAKIDLDLLTSRLICCLLDELSEKDYPESSLCYWVPVYGVLWGIFNIKRELGSKDVGNLKKEIFALENEHKNPSSNSQIIVPRLINLYFWLIDYYLSKNEITSNVDELLLKIKILDTSIYEQYVK